MAPFAEGLAAASSKLHMAMRARDECFTVRNSSGERLYKLRASCRSCIRRMTHAMSSAVANATPA